MNHDAHNYRSRLEGQLRIIKADPSISEENKNLMYKFKDFAFSCGISTGRIVRYLFDLRVIAQFLNKNFEDANREDIQVLVGKLEGSERFAKSTIRDIKITLRKFYKWLRNTDEFPEEVKWFKIHLKYKDIKNPEEMLTEEEIQRMINSCKDPRDKAFISMLYESGCRIGEILLLKINQVKFDQYGALLFVNGKTGFRRVRIVASVPYLVEWINNHPLKDNPKEFLWLSRDLKIWSYGAMYGMLKRTARKAKINKKFNPHNHRHSRASYLANHLTEAQMDEHFGWIQGSKMPRIYIHLSGKKVDSALLKLYGINDNNEKKESIFKPKECVRCQQTNQATNKFCSRCGMPLDEDTQADIIRKGLDRKQADKIMDGLLEDQEFREMFLRKIRLLKN
jgi:integrase/recombinase XerD